MRKQPFTFDEHKQLGEKLKSALRALQTGHIELSRRYGKTAKAARLALRVEMWLEELRCELDKQVFKDCASDAEFHRLVDVYYGSPARSSSEGDHRVEELRLEVQHRDDCQVAKPRDMYEGVPSWFIKAMKKQAPDSRLWQAELPGGDAEVSVMLFQELLRSGNRSWFDHVGWVGDRFVAEPYGLSAEGVRAIENLCARTETTFRINGKSYHYPSATLRIEIFPTQHWAAKQYG